MPAPFRTTLCELASTISVPDTRSMEHADDCEHLGTGSDFGWTPLTVAVPLPVDTTSSFAAMTMLACRVLDQLAEVSRNRDMDETTWS